MTIFKLYQDSSHNMALIINLNLISDLDIHFAGGEQQNSKPESSEIVALISFLVTRASAS